MKMDHIQQIREVPGAAYAVVFLHGILESPAQFADLMDSVPPYCSVYNLLLPGHGGDPQAFAGSGVEKWRSFVLDWISRLSGSHRRVVIAGHSMGALLAMEAAVRFPESMAGLFLMAVPLKIRVRPGGFSNAFRILRGRIREDDPIAPAVRRTFALDGYVPLRIAVRWIPRYLELFRMARQDRRIPESLECPVMVYQSGKDEFVGRSSAKYLKNVPHVTVRTAAHSRHFDYIPEERRELLACFREFLEDVLPPVSR